VLAPQRAQVQHAPVRGAEKCPGDREAAGVGRSGLAHAHDAAGIIDVVGAARPPPERPQVHGAELLRPEERVPAAAHDRGMVVDRERHARACPQGSKISHAFAHGPEEGAGLTSRRLREAHHLSAVVHIMCDARRSTQRVAARAYSVTQPVHRLGLAHGAAQRAQLVNRDYRRPSWVLAHNPASTAASAAGPSNRRTRIAARPSRLTATMWRIATWPSAGLYLSRSCAPPASPAEPSRIVGWARPL